LTKVGPWLNFQACLGLDARYDSRELNADGFPAFPSGLRETAQHHEWISLYRAFQRVRVRAAAEKSGHADVSQCPVCLRLADRPDRPTHPRCLRVIEYLRELGPQALERIRSVAFPDDARTVAPPTRRA
jgi:hypothetical protein